VLKSWAVPKGPSLDPSVRCLAVQVEDHPLEYGVFEGTIPQGQYGGGSVLLWDRGHWTPRGDAGAGLRAGRLEFDLDGAKLKGGWRLVRIRNDGAKANWLLMKMHDKYERPAAQGVLTEERPESVKSGRIIEQIGEGGAVWPSVRTPGKETAKQRIARAVGSGKKKAAKPAMKPTAAKVKSIRSHASAAPPRAPRTRSHALAPGDIPGAAPAEQPDTFAPQLATLVDAAPAGDGWLHEIKYDGYRIVAIKHAARVTLLSRNGLDWTARAPRVAEAIAALPIDRAILDGELMVLDKTGVSSFQAMQNALQQHVRGTLVYYAFDLPHAGGYDLTDVPLADRKRALAALLAGLEKAGPVRYSDHIVGRGPDVFFKACERGLEGIISKRVDSTYEARRGRAWVKVKCLNAQEFVVGGFTDPAGSRVGFGALLLGFNEGGKLRYCGRVGTGFDDNALRAMHRTLRTIEQPTPAFANPPRGAEARGVHWVTPQLVVQVEYREMTSEGILRHPSYQGVRPDKPAREVVRETPRHQEGRDEVAKGRRGSVTHKKHGVVAKALSTKPVSKKHATGDDTEIAGVRLSSPDKVLYADAGITKGEVAEYYTRVAEYMLPHVENRPLTLVRCPGGVGGQCFYQKHPLNDGALPGLAGVEIQETTKSGLYAYITGVQGLIALVQKGTLEIHTWGSRVEDLEHPDQIILDLDPGPGVTWPAIIEGARTAREHLKRAGLESFVKTSGGKGLHVVVPLKPLASWDEVKGFAQSIAASLVREKPSEFVGTMSKAARPGKIFVDDLRNGRGATCVAAYSTRARAGGMVSVPLTWAGLARVEPSEFDVRTTPTRLRKGLGNAWEGFFGVRQALTPSVLKQFARHTP